MREYRSPSGEMRLWFDDNEIEDTMARELGRGGMYSRTSDAVVDLEALLEFHLEVKLDLYAELEPDLLGVTEFATGMQPLVKINRELTAQVDENYGSGGILGRWRATLAHEAAHVILHRRIVDHPSEQGTLFSHGRESRTKSTRCLERNIQFTRGSGDWKEVQANRGMAGLLMPAGTFVDLARDVVGAETMDDLLAHVPAADTRAFSDLVRELAERFRVSREAAGIRLNTLGLTRNSREPMMSLESYPKGGRRIGRHNYESIGSE